jgi:hypothetical protein
MSLDAVSGMSGSSFALPVRASAETPAPAATQSLAAQQVPGTSQAVGAAQILGATQTAGVTQTQGVTQGSAPAAVVLPKPAQPFLKVPTEPLTPKVLAELIGRQLP